MYFVALVCPPSLNEKILAFKNRMKEQFGCVVALRSPAHITLVPPFWMDDTREEDLLRTLETFTSNTGEIEIHIKGFSHFGKRVLFAAVGQNPTLQSIKLEVENHFVKNFSNIKKEERPFHPHITIANRDMKPSDFDQAWEYFSKKDLNEKFEAAAISLLRHEEGKWNVVREKKW